MNVPDVSFDMEDPALQLLKTSFQGCNAAFLNSVDEPASTSETNQTALLQKTISNCLARSSTLMQFFEEIKLTSEQIKEIETLTRGQKENVFWPLYREQRLTASNFATFEGCHKGTYVTLSKTATNLLSGTKNVVLNSLSAIKWGSDHERDAVKIYEKALNTSVEERGIILHPSGALGASLDGVSASGTLLMKLLSLINFQGELQYKI